MSVTYVDLFADGSWIKAPAVEISGNTVVVTGSWLKLAAIKAEECLEHELQDPERCVEMLREHRADLKADIFTFAQKLPATTPKYGYATEWDSIAAIRLSTFAEWWDDLPQESRKNARRAAKRGVTIAIQTLDDDLVRAIVAINDETPVRQGKRFTHFGESFAEVKRDFLSFENRSDLICAYHGGELIGLVKIIYCGPIAAIMKLQTKMSHYDKRPGNALLTRALERCGEVGAAYVTYGRYRYGNQAHTSLMEFKARHGFEEILVPRYFVPLTSKGQVSTALKLHRGLVGLLPAPVIQAGRRIRAAVRRADAMRSSV